LSQRLPENLTGPHAATPAGKPRARSLGIPFGGIPGQWNAITDVPGLEVGYTTLIRGDAVRTGVTAILPRGPPPPVTRWRRTRTRRLAPASVIAIVATDARDRVAGLFRARHQHGWPTA
jgi:L-aminopeptidase/D-esterase-like protein